MDPDDARRRRPWWFWMLLAIIGACTPIIVAVAFAAVIVAWAGMSTLLSAGPSAVLQGGSLPRFFGLVQFGLIFGWVLAPLTALAVPASYRASLIYDAARPNLPGFVIAATAFGVLGPFVLEAILLAFFLNVPPTAPGNTFGISFLYAFFGIAVAPVSALVLWPFVRRLDARFGVGASGKPA